MKKRRIVWLVVASALLVVGCLTFTISMSLNDWKFTNLSISKYTNNSIEIANEYQNITLSSKEADVKIVPSLDEITTITYFDQEDIKYDTEVVEGSLKIEIKDNRKWYDHIFNFKTPYITISLPAGEYGDLKINSSSGDVKISSDFTFSNIEINLSTGDVDSEASVEGLTKIKTSTGDIELDNVTTQDLDLTVTTGDISIKNTTCTGNIKISVDTGDAELENVSCTSLYSTGDTGDIELKDFIASENISIKRDTGDVEFVRSDAAEIYVKTSTGSVTGSLLSAKIFFPQSSTGNISIPKTTTGGVCEIITSTGDIEISIH